MTTHILVPLDDYESNENLYLFEAANEARSLSAFAELVIASIDSRIVPGSESDALSNALDLLQQSADMLRDAAAELATEASKTPPPSDFSQRYEGIK